MHNYIPCELLKENIGQNLTKNTVHDFLFAQLTNVETYSIILTLFTMVQLNAQFVCEVICVLLACQGFG